MVKVDETLDAARLRTELEKETLAMSLHLAGDGKALPGELVEALRWLDAGKKVPVEQLAAAHAELSELVFPARPQTLSLLSRISIGGKGLATVSITRSMLFVAVFSMIVMVPLRIVAHGHMGILFDFIEEFSLMATAALGAAFQSLTRINQEIVGGTYDPRHNAGYWTRIVLGIISGTILSSLLEVPEEPASTAQVGKDVLALLGGYSAGLVHRILDRLVSSVESIFGVEARASAGAGRSGRTRGARAAFSGAAAEQISGPKSERPSRTEETAFPGQALAQVAGPEQELAAPQGPSSVPAPPVSARGGSRLERR